MTVNLKMRRKINQAVLYIPSIRQFMALLIASQVALTGATVSASEVIGNHRHRFEVDDSEDAMPTVPTYNAVTVQPTAPRPAPAVIPAPIVFPAPAVAKPQAQLVAQQDEAVGAEQARRYAAAHPLAPVPTAVDQAPPVLKPLVAMGSVFGSVGDTIGDGLGLHRWDQMSLKELSRRYSQNPTVAATMQEMEAGTAIRRDAGRGIQSGKLSSKSTNRCFMYVQIALGKGKLAPDQELRQLTPACGREVCAKNAGTALTSKKYGFVNLLDMPQFRSQIIEANGHINLPMGAIMVYGGSGNGHIEQRTPSGYASDYLSTHNRTGDKVAFGGRVLTGVYIRPELVN
jgi:hypothetical protein